uniref:Ribosomal RNA-processing protein 43 n=1 Tax=Clastoptera arizonana TaxID=38151 RepID=A0A1B6CB03_9HEMI
MSAFYKNVHPTKFYRDYLAHDIRPDGRGLQTFRPVSVNVGTITTAEGSAVIKIGNTTVVCGIKAELATPKAEEPDRGYVVTNVDLPPLCSSKFRPGPPSEEAQIYTAFMEHLVTQSSMIDTKQLCIAHDKLAWVLYCDMICLDHDGSILDACVAVLSAALKTVTLPEVEYEGITSAVVVHSEKRKPLKLDSCPIATSFSIFDDKIILADPNEEEEHLSTGVMTIVTQEGMISSVHKPGGSPLSEIQVDRCIHKAIERSELMIKLIDTAFKGPDG